MQNQYTTNLPITMDEKCDWHLRNTDLYYFDDVDNDRWFIDKNKDERFIYFNGRYGVLDPDSYQCLYDIEQDVTLRIKGGYQQFTKDGSFVFSASKNMGIWQYNPVTKDLRVLVEGRETDLTDFYVNHYIDSPEMLLYDVDTNKEGLNLWNYEYKSNSSKQLTFEKGITGVSYKGKKGSYQFVLENRNDSGSCRYGGEYQYTYSVKAPYTKAKLKKEGYYCYSRDDD